jgi:hypothetical protein
VRTSHLTSRAVGPFPMDSKKDFINAQLRSYLAHLKQEVAHRESGGTSRSEEDANAADVASLQYSR